VRARDGAVAVVECGPTTLRIAGLAAPAGAAIRVGIRPERVRLAKSAPREGHPALRGTIDSITYAGNLVRYYVRSGGDALLMIERQVQHGSTLREGQAVWVEWDHDAVMAWPEPAEGG
jgi:ABC-type Fe3+/spermidine/putrescine transport system ATPase subunit